MLPPAMMSVTARMMRTMPVPMRGVIDSPKTVMLKKTAVSGSNAPKIAVGVEPMYWMALVVQRNEMAGREDGQREQIAPQVPFVDDEQLLPELDADEEKAEPDHERVERQGQRRDLLQQRLVDTHDVNGIRERGGDDKGDADGVERRPVFALIEQADADERQPDANEGLYRQLLLEEDCHNEGDQYRIDKQDGRSDAGFHVIITFEQRQRRDRHQQSHDDNRG